MQFRKIFLYAMICIGLGSCSAGNRGQGGTASTEASDVTSSGETNESVAFDADSAYNYIARQVAFGPRVPNTSAHRQAGDWLAAELRRHGAEVTEQTMTLRAFDGTQLQSRNIFGQYNPDASERILLLAHWDCRPWADKDPDPAKRLQPVDGANDGASGVGVLLEVARQLNQSAPQKGVDILFVDAEDWGEEANDESWALGTKYFAENRPVEGYSPLGAILLDMVGGKGATFYREYFSERSAPWLADAIWQTASAAGYGAMFPNSLGSAVTDDHIQLISHGIPAIDIIDYRGEEGFYPDWHTSRDTMEGIDRQTLQAVGETLMTFLRNF